MRAKYDYSEVWAHFLGLLFAAVSAIFAINYLLTFLTEIENYAPSPVEATSEYSAQKPTSTAQPDASQRVVSSDGWAWPVIGNTILCSDEADHLRRDSVNAWDFCMPKGTPIYPIRPGTVGYAGCNNAGKYGCWVIVNHHNGYRSYYAHMIRGSITVKKGQKVGYNTILGRIGWTGATSFGPHTHIEIRKGWTPVRPSDFLIRPQRTCRLCNYK